MNQNQNKNSEHGLQSERQSYEQVDDPVNKAKAARSRRPRNRPNWQFYDQEKLKKLYDHKDTDTQTYG